MGSPPPRSGRSIDFFDQKNRYLVTLAPVSPRRNNRSRAQTSIFAIENLMSSTRARRQEARKCRPEEFSARMKSFNSHCFFSISALLHQCTKAWIIPKPFISYWFFQYFCSPALGHEGRKSTKVIHFLFCLVFLLLAQGFWDLDIGLWIFGFWTPDFGFRMLNFRFSTLTFGLWPLDVGFWILDFGFWNSGQGFRIVQSPWTLGFGPWPLGYGLCVLGFGLWTLGFGFWI